MLLPSHSKSFTLLELLIVIGIIAVLSTALIMVIRPAEQFRKGRDSSRVSQLDSLRTALNMALMENVSLGEDHTVYLSLPSNDPSCSDLSLPPLPNSWTYHCSNSQNFRKIDGTGWIPINFTELVTVNLPALPIDPLNNTTYYFTYTTGGSYELTALLESPERHDPALNDGDAFPGLYAVGTSLNLTPRTRDLGLVGYWKMDESSWTDNCSTLTVQDSSGYGNHGKACPNGYGPVTAPGKAGNAGSFDGSDDYIQTSAFSIPNTTGTLTISAWVNCAILGQLQTILGESNQDAVAGFIWLFRDTANGLLYQYATGSTYFTVGASNFFLNYDNQWVLVTTVADYNNKYVKFYRNGILFYTYTTSYNMVFPNTSRTKYIGAYGSHAHYMNGLIDDVRIYNRALSAEEIQATYNATK